MNYTDIPQRSDKVNGIYYIYKTGVSGSTVLYIHYFLGIGKGFLIFLFRDYIYNIFILSSKLTYLLLTSNYNYIRFYLSSGIGGVAQ
ncbi:MAG: hypothetical protein ACYCT2_04810 [Thermoplasmataceae archaeon]